MTLFFRRHDMKKRRPVLGGASFSGASSARVLFSKSGARKERGSPLKERRARFSCAGGNHRIWRAYHKKILASDHEFLGFIMEIFIFNEVYAFVL